MIYRYRTIPPAVHAQKIAIVVMAGYLLSPCAWAEDADPNAPQPKAPVSAEVTTGPLNGIARTNVQNFNDEDAARMEALLGQEDLPGAIHEITLAEALTKTASRNLSLVEFRMEIEKADTRVKQAWAAVIPTLQADLQYTRADHADRVNFGGRSIEVNPANTLTGGITAAVPLVNAGVWKGIQLSQKSEDLTKLSVEDLKRTVLFGTAKAYYTALMSLSLVELYKVQIRSTYHHLDVAKQKLKAGSGLRIDVLRASIILEKAEKSLSNARLSLASACDALGVLIGENTMVMPTQTASLRVPLDDEDALIQQAEKERLDLAVQRKNLELAGDQIDAAWWALLPSLNLGWKGTYKFTKPGDMGATDRSRWYLFVNLVVPLFNYGNYPKITEGKLSRRQAEVKIERLMQSMGQEIRQAHREYQTALTDVESAERQLELAKETLKIAETAFEAGAGTSLEVTDARRIELEAGVNLVTSELKTQLALLNLLEAIGRSPLSIGPA